MEQWISNEWMVQKENEKPKKAIRIQRVNTTVVVQLIVFS